MKCATGIFAWFGVAGKWSIPFERDVEEWRSKNSKPDSERQDTGGTRFRVIDPPRVSPEPIAPRRITLLIGALIAALGAGVVASFVACQIMPIFHDDRSLRETSKRPILGMVSLLPNERILRKRRHNAYLFAGGLGSLLASFTAIFAIAMVIGRAG